MTPGLSVILITWNEEARLARTLDSVTWADEVVIVDRGSTDGTEAVARRYTDRFYVREWPGYGEQKQRALELATGDWVLSLDADEVVAPALREGIQGVLAAPGDVVAYDLQRWTWYLGHWFGSRGWHREWQCRLFRRDRARFRPVAIHEGVEVDGPTARLRAGPLLHYSYRDIGHHLEKMRLYTGLAATQRRNRGRRDNPLSAAGHGVAGFLREYIVQGGFLYGGAGLVAAWMGGTYAFLKHARAWEVGLDVQANGSRPR